MSEGEDMSIWDKMNQFFKPTKVPAPSTNKDVADKMSDFSQVLAESNIIVELEVSSRNQLLKYLANLTHKVDPQVDSEAIYGKFLMREQAATTELGDGIAMPHVQDPSIGRLTMMIIKLKQPIKWTEHIQIDTVLSFLIPDSEPGFQHISYQASVARLLMQKKFQRELQHAQTPQQIYSLFVE